MSQQERSKSREQDKQPSTLARIMTLGLLALTGASVFNSLINRKY
jgi:hypothetical protein